MKGEQAVTPNTRTGVLLVAERDMCDTASPLDTVLATKLRADVSRWYYYARRVECFHGGRDVTRLRSLGIRWTAAMNLTLPAPQGEPFDLEFGTRVADHVCARASEPLVICVGARVCEAFGWDDSQNFALQSVYSESEVPGVVARFENHNEELDGPASVPGTKVKGTKLLFRVPSPSELDSWWNEPMNVWQAQKRIEELGYFQ